MVYTKNKPRMVLLGDGTSLRYQSRGIDALMYGDGPSIDPVLDNNAWSDIKSVCASGDAANYWSLGDEKTVTCGGYSRSVMLVHIGDIYGDKKAVFQFRNRTEGDYVWSESDSTSVADADIWDDLLPTGAAFAELVPQELAEQLGDTKVVSATSSTDGTLVETVAKLFPPAERELRESTSFCRTEEAAALTTFGYYAENVGNAYRSLPKASDPTSQAGYGWWTRSPSLVQSADVWCVVDVYTNGQIYVAKPSAGGRGVAPCFAF